MSDEATPARRLPGDAASADGVSGAAPRWGDCLAVFAVACAFRGIHLAQVVGTPLFESPGSDAEIYERLAQQIVAGDVLLEARGLYYLGPLFPYVLAAVRWAFGPSGVALPALQVVLSSLSAAVLCGLGQRLFDRRTGLAAGLGVAVYGVLIFYSAIPLPATLVVFLNLAMLGLFVWALEAPTTGRWLAVGLALGAAAAARGSALFFAPFVPAVLAVTLGLRPARRRLSATAWIALGTLLAIAPVTIRNAVVGGELVPLTTNAGVNLYIGNHRGADGLFLEMPVFEGELMGTSVGAQYHAFRRVARERLGRPDASDAEVSRFWIAQTARDVVRDPAAWLRLMARKGYYALAAFEVPNNRNYEFSRKLSLLRLPLLSFGVVLPLAALGLYASRRSWRRHVPLIAFLVAQLLALVAFFVTARYRLAAAPVLTLYAAVGAFQLVDWVRARRLEHALVALAGMLLLGVWLHAFEPHIDFATSYERLGLAHAKRGDDEAAIAAYDAALAIAPQRAFANFEKGRALARLGREREAREYLGRALRRAEATGDRSLARRVRRALTETNAKGR